MEFWNDWAIDRSWKVLQMLAKEFDVVVIGGWGAYLYTKTIKSKDVGVLTDFTTLDEIGKRFPLRKNVKLRKYEVIVDEVSIDIYVFYYSKFVIPASELLKLVVRIEGIKTLCPEALVILKQQAEKERTHSVKGLKDRVDIINLLINSNFDWESIRQ